MEGKELTKREKQNPVQNAGSVIKALKKGNQERK